jgi:hypothetical protein
MAKEEERTMRFPLIGQNAEYEVDAVFSDDGRLIDLWIAAEGDAAVIDEGL